MVKTLIAIILCLSFVAPVSAAAPLQPKPAATKVKPAKPDWAELTPAQQAVLAPLKEDWSTLDTTRRRKWIKIANGYPKMKPKAQQLLQKRMQEWAKLTPEQRRVAREKYRRAEAAAGAYAALGQAHAGAAPGRARKIPRDQENAAGKTRARQIAMAAVSAVARQP
ncbi:MAG: DUF3106 domain-containing protein, partial [Betaproteobacteria bacterium]|nr:DUF3106 domain-containing protein [Betaproteobacteria bacterium]